jgi:heme exporter protein C
MLKFLYRFGSPKTFYRYSSLISSYLGFLSLLLVTIGWGWGLLFSPADYQQGDSVRIMYIHVPAAFLSLLIYTTMAISAAMTLIWQIKVAGLLQKACAQVGLIMTFLALVTGSLWGKPTWGTWWVWDARLTGELVLLFIYISLLALDQTLGKNKGADKIIAMICWVGFLDLPIIHYSVQWWNTLHQGSSILVLAKPKIHTSMLYPLFTSLVGMMCFSFWAILSLTQMQLLRREYKQQWVKELGLK